MSGSDDYNSGLPYDPPPRRRRRLSEQDDAWAAADQDDLADDGVEIEDLAAGYGWEDRDRYGQEPPDDESGDLPPSMATPLPRRTSLPHRPMAAQRYDRDYALRRGASYHRDQARRGEFGEYYGPVTPPAPKPVRKARPDTFTWIPRGLPYWQVLLLVVLSVVALLACVLACASVWVAL